MDPKNYLKSFFTEYWKYLAVSTACKLGIFEHLHDFRGVRDLARELCLDVSSLEILLNALCSIGFLDRDGQLYKINEFSSYLLEDHPESLKYACLLWGEEHLTAWQNLELSIRTGRSTFEEIYKTNFFEYILIYSDKFQIYHKAMCEYARDDYKRLPEVIDFSQYKTVMDVGGGYGVALRYIKEKYPQVKCILFDLPEVIENAKFDDIEKIGGSFFDAVPNGADLILLSRVLHDWDDGGASLILRNCYQALPENGNLLIIESCTDHVKQSLDLLSLNMLVICGSFERSSTHYIQLAQNSGFVFENKKSLNELQTMLIFRKL